MHGERATAGDIPCLSGVDATILADLTRNAEARKLPSGSVRVLGDDELGGILFVAEGTLRLVRTGPGRLRQIVGVLGPGECHCLPPPPGAFVRPLTIECRSAVKIAILGARALAPLVASCASYREALFACLGRRIAELQDRLAGATALSLRQRLAALLADLARRYGVPSGGALRIEGGWTHAELAEMLGSSREVVSRSLAALREAGLIAASGRRIFVLDPMALDRLAGGAVASG